MTKRLTMVRFLASALFILPPCTARAGLGAPDEGERQLLGLFGRKVLDSTGASWPLEPGITAHAVFQGERLAVLQVSLAADDRREGEGLTPRCCISSEKYGALMDLVGRFRPLGESQGVLSLSVVGPSGWTTSSTEYANARVVRFEKRCGDTKDVCGVARFTVYYWVATEGHVTRRRVRDVTLRDKEGHVIDRRLTYLLRVENVELEVSEADYSRTREGECVRVERLLTNTLARVLPCRVE